MNFFSKLAMFVTLSTVMFSGFAMDSGDFPSLAGWLESAPAVTENVVATVVTPAVQEVVAHVAAEEAVVTAVTPATYKEQAIQLLGTASDKAKTAYAATKCFLLNSKDSALNFGANSYEAGKGFVVGSYELAKNDPARFGANATGALVVTGMGALVLYNLYSMVKAPKALESNVSVTEDQIDTFVVVQETEQQAEQETTQAPIAIETSTEVVKPVVVKVSANPAPVKKTIGSGFAKALARNAQLAKNK